MTTPTCLLALTLALVSMMLLLSSAPHVQGQKMMNHQQKVTTHQQTTNNNNNYTLLYLPLDERYTTRDAFLNLAASTPFNVLTPPTELLPSLRTPPNLTLLHLWVNEVCQTTSFTSCIWLELTNNSLFESIF